MLPYLNKIPKYTTISFQTVLMLLIFFLGILSSCDKEDTVSCKARKFTGTNNCGSSGYAVSSTGCCPAGYPYVCANKSTCYFSCETAEKACSGNVIEGDWAGNGGGGGGTGAGYDYTYTCVAGSGGTVPIPAASPACQKAYEYYARVYGCNDVSQANIDAANCGMCKACGYQNYCSLCP